MSALVDQCKSLLVIFQRRVPYAELVFDDSESSLTGGDSSHSNTPLQGYPMGSNLLVDAHGNGNVPKSDIVKDSDQLRPQQKDTFWSRNWYLALVLAFIGGLAIATAVLVPSVRAHYRNGERRPRERAVQLGNGADDVLAARTYYIQAELIDWEYMPLGYDVCAYNKFKPVEVPAPRLKAVFRQYTDSSFQTPVARTEEDQHLGILGPFIRAEAGSTILVVFKNNVSVPLNIEPSGVQYDTPGMVNPGDVVSYTWFVPDTAAPGPDATTTSSLWLYRSSVHVTADINAGLFGPIIVTRKGEATEDGRPKGVGRELVAVLNIMDETNALHTIMSDMLPKSGMRGPVPGEEERHHTINGLLNCNQQGFNVSFGAKARFYVAALGNEADVHTMHWHGVTLEKDGHRVDQVVLVAGAAATLDFTADNPGSWFMHCHVNDHLVGGMKALMTISDGPRPVPEGNIRQYYVAAEVVEWDYAPSGMDLCSAQPEPLSEDALVFLAPGPNRIGRKYLKARYIEYTDDTFTTKKTRSEAELHLGLQGPVFKGSVGETIQVLFKNMIPGHNVSLHPHGVLYAKDSEGALYGDYTSGADKADDDIPTNQTHLYKWVLPERSGPGPADPNSIVWMYHSHVNEVEETYAGLYGALVVTRKGELVDTNLPSGVDTELFAVFLVVNEVKSFLFSQNMAKYLNITNPAAIAKLAEDEDFQESNLMHSINGYMFCNLPGLKLKQGGQTRWYFMGYGNEVDMHTPNTYASRFNVGPVRRQSMRLLPGSMVQADMQAMVPGTWPVLCNVNDHISAGMRATYNVTDEGRLADAVTGVTRSYFIQAEELVWDFSPLGFDGCSGTKYDEEHAVYMLTTPTTLGSKYRKAVFRGYTDATFTQRAPTAAFMGVLGPLLRAEVGDKLEVTFKNTATFPVSLQIAGGLWPLNAESTPIEPVAPGQTKVYSYVVPADAAPGKDSTTGVAAYMYLSGQDLVPSSYAGLVGVMLVGEKGTFTGPDGRTKDVDVELPLLFSVMDESQSPFLDANVKAQAKAAGVNAIYRDSEDFVESNKMHSINGFMLCNMPEPSVPANGKALVILMGLGTEVDMHGPVFTGQDLQLEGHPTWAPVIMPTTVEVGVLTAAPAPGSWEFYCMVSDHYSAGMRAKLSVSPSGTAPMHMDPGRHEEHMRPDNGRKLLL